MKNQGREETPDLEDAEDPKNASNTAVSQPIQPSAFLSEPKAKFLTKIQSFRDSISSMKVIKDLITGLSQTYRILLASLDNNRDLIISILLRILIRQGNQPAQVRNVWRPSAVVILLKQKLPVLPSQKIIL